MFWYLKLFAITKCTLFKYRLGSASMNCLNSRHELHEFDPIEPSAPFYYPPQPPPYNPEYIYGVVECQSASFSPAHEWGASSESYAKSTCTDERGGGWGRPRRSLYEGVNCMPVSETNCVRRAARLTIASRLCYVLFVRQSFINSIDGTMQLIVLVCEIT